MCGGTAIVSSYADAPIGHPSIQHGFPIHETLV